MNIIAVDDEKLALRDLTQILELVLPEASVSGFRTPQEALAHAWAVPVDIAFLDVEMKGMNGLELAKQLKDIRGGRISCLPPDFPNTLLTRSRSARATISSSLSSRRPSAGP